MKKEKQYDRVRFSADVVRNALDTFHRQFDTSGRKFVYLQATVDGATWGHDSLEEFFADFVRSPDQCTISEEWDLASRTFRMDAFRDLVKVGISAPTRGEIETTFNVFEQSVAACRIPEPPPPPAPPPEPPPPPPVIFIGHGGSPLWKELKDHLHEKHSYQIEAYEIGARAGLGIWSVLDGMLVRSSIAILVMTGEDEAADGRMLARQNVVHEIGLFQGRLGPARAIVLLEKGTDEFSNIHGLNQIRFNPGRIIETFGDVLATLKREFPLST